MWFKATALIMLLAATILAAPAPWNTNTDVGGATVQDLIDCLGTSTRFFIEAEADGLGIFIKSSPYKDYGEVSGDQDVSDCLIKTGIYGAAGYMTVPLSELYPSVNNTRADVAAVPLDFIPTSP